MGGEKPPTSTKLHLFWSEVAPVISSLTHSSREVVPPKKNNMSPLKGTVSGKYNFQGIYLIFRGEYFTFCSSEKGLDISKSCQTGRLLVFMGLGTDSSPVEGSRETWYRCWLVRKSCTMKVEG